MKLKLPQFYTTGERSEALAQLDHGRAQISPYRGDWKAQWLLSELDAAEWVLRTPFTRLVNGEWKGTRRVSWEIGFPDGGKLTDESNWEMRLTCQRIAFLVRKYAVCGITSVSTHAGFVLDFLDIIRWLYHHEEIYRPRTHLFTRVNGQAIQEFMDAYVTGGKMVVLRYRERFLDIVYQEALAAAPPSEMFIDSFQVPAEHRSAIIDWLRKNDFYVNATNRNWNTSVPHLDRKKIAHLLATEWNSVKTLQFSAFLRQFEPELSSVNSRLLLPVEGSQTEFPSHRILEITDVCSSKFKLEGCLAVLLAWEALFRLRLHLPDALPVAERLEMKVMRSRVTRLAAPSKHTPWVPLKTALAYTTEALRWVHVYGDDLVEFYIAAASTFKKNSWFDEVTSSARVNQRKIRDEWVRTHIPCSLRKLGISRWTSWFNQGQEDTFSKFRNGPGLNDALQVLVGAITVLVATVKPIRASEMLLLKRKCVTFIKDDGYWLEHPLRKNNIDNLLTETNKPIPTSAAKAIAQLAKLGDALSRLVDEKDTHASEALYYLPTFNENAGLKPRLVDDQTVQMCTDRFCDFVALPCDHLGRRWYVRRHELRKSFLITLFWSFRYASLDAARWIAGHNDPKHVYDYIQANFPGEELPQIEAEYAATQLWDFEAYNGRTEAVNTQSLYRAVCQHFGVRAINLLSEKDLLDWLEVAFRTHEYQVIPYVVEHRDGSKRTEIAFKIFSS